MAQIERLWANLRGLGVRRLSALALIGVAVFATTGLAGYYLSRPTMETLYSGLDRDDIAAIGAALREAGVPFDVNAESTVVLKPAGQAAAARMILAEKGLPRGGAIGNELYDKLGSLGLTSFMQDVTRLRALEGELARTIQMMRTVKAARVHIVLADEGSFRRERQPSSASVVIRTDGGDDRATGQAIRHLVASAVPGMKLEDVTVLNVDGSLLAYGADSVEKSPDNLLALEKEVSQLIRENISRTLTPYLSAQNFQISVAARLNADKTQTNETIYSPDSRVERSVRVTKEQQSSQNAAGEQPAGVEANLPKPNTTSGESKQSNDQTQKREELTNYEISSKSIQTTSAGFLVQNLSVAVLINRAALAASLGSKPSAEAVDAQVHEIEQLVGSAAGLNRQRGDAVKISVVDFVDSSRDLEPAPGPSLVEIFARQTGSILNAGAIVAVAGMMLWFGVRPGLRMAFAPPRIAAAEDARGESGRTPALGAPDDDSQPHESILIETDAGHDEFMRALVARRDNGPERKLLKLIEFDENHAATILKQWIRQGANG
ncbi:MAG TPA: flagellar basal-body MS-ring/collar protein FliF [Roseiarcus sp.]